MEAARGRTSEDQDVLENGDDHPRRPAFRLAGLAVLLMGAGALAGFQAQKMLAGEPEADGGAPTLVAGMVETDTQPGTGDFVVPLHNGTDREVEIVDVELEGWDSAAAPVTITPGGWADVGIDVTVDCDSTPFPGRDVVVRTATGDGEVEQVLRMPGLPSALSEELDRLCGYPAGRAPTRQELVGVWLVERAHEYAGQLLMMLNRDGTFAMDRDVGLFSDPDARGTFSLSGHWLTLDAVGGRDCEPTGRGVFFVGLLGDGRLHIFHITDYMYRWCSLDPEDVWIAKPAGMAPASAEARSGGASPGGGITARPGHP